MICLGLQKNDEPKEDAGIERLYHWMTGPGRVSVAPPPPTSGLQGKVSLEYFMNEAAAPAIGALMGCTSFKLVGEPTISPGTQTRGELATQMIDVLNKPPTDPEEIALTAMVAAPDSYLEAVLEAAREGRAPPPAPLTGGGGSKIPERSRFLFSLEEARARCQMGHHSAQQRVPCLVSRTLSALRSAVLRTRDAGCSRSCIT